MSTANKLTYLNGTKQAIKQAINEDFEVIYNNTTFREYADEISSNNAKYKNLIPKETKNATNTLDISNSSGLDKALVTQYGNTYQETNANVFNDTLAQTTYTGTGAVVENSPTRFNFINGYTYTINIKFTSNNVNTINQNRILGIRTYKDIGYTGRGVIINSDNLSSGTGSITFTVEENYNRFNFINYADFQSGTITITDFEIITNTPSPDYPQEIVNISGKSTLKDAGKNLFDKNNANIFRGYANNNSVLANSDSATTIYTLCKPNTTYTVKKSASGTNNRFCVFTTASVPTAGNSVLNYVGTRQGADDNTDYTITTPAEANYLCVFIGVSSTTPTASEIFASIQIEENTTATPYEAYKEQSFDIDLPSGIELCKIGTYKDRIYKSTGKNLFDKDNANEVTGYFNTGVSTISSSSQSKIVYIPCNPNTTYTVSKITSSRFFVGYTKTTPALGIEVFGVLGENNKTTPTTITTSNNAKYLVAFIYHSNYDTSITYQQILDSIQIEENSTATTYEGYGKKWYLEKKIGKVVLDGSESWNSWYNVGNNIGFYYNNNSLAVIGVETTLNGALYCNKFSETPLRTDIVYGDVEAIKHCDGTGQQYIALGVNKTRLSDYSTKALAISSLKSWLSSNNVYYYYVLATLTTEEITESNYPTLYNQLNNIKLYEGVNHLTFTNESGLDVEFDIEYYKDWKLD